jgi:hypothetical protein
MHDSYVGDVGDFVKFGLMRWLHQRFPQGARGGVAWFATCDAGGSAGDGRHLNYLDDPRFAFADPELLVLMRGVVAGGRRIERLEQAGLLPASTVWFSETLDAPSERRREHRRTWLECASANLAQVDWVFADPDNGVASEKVSFTEARARKYAFLSELQALTPGERTLIVYQHQDRSANRGAQVARLAERLRAAFPQHGAVRVVVAPLVSSRFFGIVAAKRHVDVVERALEALRTSPWAGILKVAP